MKNRFTSLDIACIVKELKALISMRVNQVYDIDHKTYLIRFQATDKKAVLLLESGNRIHTTKFDWPKNDHPSGFSMKLRKHLRNKRLENVSQLKNDRIVKLEFGSGDAAYYIFLELFDKGNIILTDCNLTIVYILRPHTEGEFKFYVKETYSLDRLKNVFPSEKPLRQVLEEAQEGDHIKKLIFPFADYGPSVCEHILANAGFSKGEKLKKPFTAEEIDKILEVVEEGNKCAHKLTADPSPGYIFKKKDTKAGGEVFFSNVDFQPFIFKQFTGQPYDEMPDFNTAVDEYFSKMEGQKIDLKALQEEKAALKKVEKIRMDQELRIKSLDKKQEVDTSKAELINYNVDLVDSAIKAINTALASQMSWNEIDELVANARSANDPVASAIKSLKLESNSITLHLKDPFHEGESYPGMLIDIDLDLSAFGNVKKYYSDKKSASLKQQKTLQAQGKALKTAEKKAESVLKEIQTNVSITKSRTVFWFEKFFWFVSSENYLVIGSRDKIQIELLIRRYLHPNDVFVHSDIPDSSCFVIQNPNEGAVPPKTLNEAGLMAVCFSSAWEAHVLASAWWVRGEHVVRSQQSGRGPMYSLTANKNYLLPSQLAIGFGFLFYIDPSSVERHANERIVKYKEDDPPDDLNPSVSESIEEITLEETAGSENGELDGSKHSLPESSDSSSEDEGDNLSSHSKDSDQDEDSGAPKNSQEVIPIDEDSAVSEQDADCKNSTTKRGNSKKEPLPEKVEPPKETNVIKRGQRSKLKKIKEKYKYQDEEEKQLKMALLQSAGSKKETPKKKGKQTKGKVEEKRVFKPKPEVKDKDTERKVVEEDDSEVPVVVDLSIVNQLTGIPLPEDSIIFALPVVAPYSTLIPYKYRVKMIPGTAKRGKSARSALNVFLNSKESNEKEKAVMKNVNDAILCRDLPGKVKLSIGLQAAKFKKKK